MPPQRHMVKRALVSVGLSLIWTAIAYLVWATVVRAHHVEAFQKVAVGDTLQSVLERFGQPSHLEPRHFVKGYDSGDQSVCAESCWLRLWYEVPLTFGTQPVSVDIDSQQRVIRKYRWSSP